MATIKVIFRASSTEAVEGTLFYRIIHKRKMRQLHSGHRVARQEWDEANEKLIIPADSSRQDYLLTIQNTLEESIARLTHIVTSLDKTAGDYTIEDIIEKFHTPDIVAGYISYARKLIADLKKIGKVRMADHYTTAINRFIRFNGNVEVLFTDFNATLMERFEYHLKENNICPNSISYYMRNLRAIYNKAVEAGLADSTNPFRHVYTGIAKTVKRAVDINIVKALRTMDLSGDHLAELARDLFMFSFYTRGMAIIDVAYLRKSNLKNGILTYRRHKTGQQLNIKWEPQMQRIVERYSDKDSDFMFPILNSAKSDLFKQYRLTYNKLLRRLKKLGRELGMTEPLTFHRSRHSWASIALNNNVPLSVICEGMGHDSEKTTRIYLASLDTAVVDKANSDIISLLDK